MSNDKTKASTTQPTTEGETADQRRARILNETPPQDRYVTRRELEEAIRAAKADVDEELQNLFRQMMVEGKRIAAEAERKGPLLRPRREKLHRRTLPDAVKKERAAKKR